MNFDSHGDVDGIIDWLQVDDKGAFVDQGPIK
jgi:hypothetical protein